MHSKTCTLHSRPSQGVNSRLLSIVLHYQKKKLANGLTRAMKAGSECWWTVPPGVHSSHGMTWLYTPCTGWNNLCLQQDHKCTAAVQLYFWLFTTIRATGSCPDARAEWNSWRRTLCNTQRRIHHSRDQQENWQVNIKPWKEPGLINQPFQAPEMAGSKRSSSTEDETAQNAGQNALMGTDLQPLLHRL